MIITAIEKVRKELRESTPTKKQSLILIMNTTNANTNRINRRVSFAGSVETDKASEEPDKNRLLVCYW